MSAQDVLSRPRMSDEQSDRVLGLALSATGTIVEWGAGGSTVWFLSELRRSGSAVNWVTIEHEPWIARLVWDAASAYGLGMMLACTVDTYTNPTIQVADTDVSVAIVDGRLRRRCVLAARRRWPTATIVLHDAQRTHYHSACSGMTAVMLGDRLGDMWILLPQQRRGT